ncbi:Pyridoxine/pyridoxal/pyridoxamine kinase [Andreprevotia sp. IGB-42]|uniref:pyridoxine/pyridoxal/pyridoxamine kinase n=1 Tax=Andreprevotia sp. IGB-42 TaxID=2497473 RepID=UPI0013574BC3|nr:pyridoxine/pyridoxal/pyridoxamine kinase [Andreprevotia sp. IGB-42]KAF0814872.1 Pyridoxine/pyridoxal/pyridoxamine kinase [Andreprevotia sp. IGB-42]
MTAAALLPITPALRQGRALPIDVISVQSQVVYGCVGNSVAVPTLQGLGLGVAAVPTVLLSNTPHYPSVDGGAIPDAWFSGYLYELEARGVMASVRAILLGYLGNPGQARILASWLEHTMARWPDIRVHIDPVIGDYGQGIYVSPELIPAYRQRLLPHAHGLTPNGFELARLTGRRLHGIDTVIDAARSLLVGRTEWVVVTSAIDPDSGPAMPAPVDDSITVAVVTRHGAQLLAHPRIALDAKGTGDLFSAMLTGQLLADVPLRDAAARACDEVIATLKRTRQAGCNELILNSHTALQPCSHNKEH